eukprot:CAMPEP_0202858342 /NCGR_PEP_ID=MMETSP1391-20130828/920_1 /ASSEMBLY_ACC=CAM_ASM_000867 /TAXON_ID=1034604 /ORGANISM="Chlamydomonas leiostraca, Strain SAG 11-49" /LENGTH=614 /DNA_ID=CAMNT_0049537255 /DNA_START=81 /DNA_END=1922 /DNA_ORIENTATION=+
MPGEQHDTKYLQGLVGEALARGCAAVVAAQPNDPVEYLGQWLVRYVKNAQIVGEHAKQKQAELEAKKAALEAEQAAAAKAKAEEEERRAAIKDLAGTVAEPRELLQKAVNLIVKYTSAGAAYAAMVSEPEEPDWQYPEDPEDPAAAESDDEADPAPPAEGEAPPDGEAPPPEEAAPEATEESGEPGAPKIPKPIDYSKKYLSYAAATAGQEFMSVADLQRPPPPPEDDPEAKVDPMPFTFRILDEKRPLVYTPNVAFENNVRFFKNFPKVGAYQACGVQAPGTGEFKAVVAADTLFPEGGGQPMSQEDQDFIWHVSRALSQAYDAVEQQAAATLEGKSAKEAMEALQKAIHDIYFPPPPEPVEGEAAAAPPAPAAAAPAEDALAEGEAPPAEEAGDDPVSILKGEVKALEEQLKAAEDERAKATGLAEVAAKVLATINGAVTTAGEVALPVLRHTRTVPQATFHVLKAVAHVLNKEPDTLKNWKRMFVHFELGFFAEVAAYDATADRDLDAWKRARVCYKGLPAEGAQKALEDEMPESHLGALLLMWLKQARKVGRRAAAQRAAQKAEDDLRASLEAKNVELAEAEKKKAEEEEAARLAAEAEAAAAAAAEAAE